MTPVVGPLLLLWTFVPAQAFRLPDHPAASAIVSFLLTWTWPVIDGLLRLPPWMQKLHLPMLPHPKAIKLATGMPMDFGRFVAVGNRGFNLERMFNLREGIDKKEDWLPRRFTHEPLSGDPRRVVPLDKMLPKYYKLRGWDSNGVPTNNTLKKLGIEFTRR